MWYTYFFFRSVIQSNEGRTDLEIHDPSEMTTSKMHRDHNYTGLHLHANYIEFS